MLKVECVVAVFKFRRWLCFDITVFESQRIEIGLGIAFPLPGLVSRCNNDLWSPGLSLYGTVPRSMGHFFFKIAFLLIIL